MAVSFQGGRELGDAEKLFCYMDQFGLGNIIVNVDCVSSYRISVENLESAFLSLVKRHPLLRMNIETNGLGEQRCLLFEPMGNPKINIEVLQHVSASEVLEQLYSFSSIDASSGPLLNVKFLPDVPSHDVDVHPHDAHVQNNDANQTVDNDVQTQHQTQNLNHNPEQQFTLILIFHHSLCDSTAVYFVINDIITNLANILMGKSDINAIESLPLKDSLENLMQVKSDPRHRSVKYLAEHFPELLSKQDPPSNIWIDTLGTEIDRDPSVRPKTYIKNMYLSKEDTAAMMIACDLHDVPPEVLLQAAVLLEISRELNIPDHELEFENAACLRELRPTYFRDNHLGFYVVRLSTKVISPSNLSRPDIWRFVKSCQEAKRADLENRVDQSFSDITSLLPLAECDHTRVRSKSLVIFNKYENLDYLDRPTDFPIRVKSAFFGAPMHLGPLPLFIVNCHRMAAKFCWSFMFYANIVSEETACKLVSSVQETISQAIHIPEK